MISGALCRRVPLTGKEHGSDYETPRSRPYEIKRIARDQREAWIARRREDGHIRWSDNPRLGHAIASSARKSFHVQRLSALDATQNAEKSIAMPGNGGIACGIEWGRTFYMADAAVELR